MMNLLLSRVGFTRKVSHLTPFFSFPILNTMLDEFSTEELKTLEAALSLIDDSGNDAARSDNMENSVDLSDPHEVEAFAGPVFQASKAEVCKDNICSSPDTQEILRLKAKLSVPGRNRSRDLQKLEVLQLRVEAAALLQRVDELKGKRDTPVIAVATVRGFPVGNSGLIKRVRLDAWQNLAMKHKKLRLEAEAENQSLREQYANQLKTVRMFKKLILKQASLKGKLDYPVQPRHRPASTVY
ncbi:hypothetical protein PPTG_05931 [Phytophthora nicotianae INRA-310]|uniref:Uncharacterized protein n=1 Tax=Phytophthora nicotianae (strain INRA-310) TaxID=761204 RepID=W2QX44_PHYN3|nr:hypothetical protein PPTG_05931 [Phytophthora nicotianae INRA-310]ETN16830.1 hypothetical protein PPTG_05931 [Phytophthora nicotianae INRA-310]